MAKNEIKIEVDLKQFNRFAKSIPDKMSKITQDSMEKTSAHLRKEFHKTIDRQHWAALQETERYKSKYPRPLQMLKGMIRFKSSKSKGTVIAMSGIFSGKAGRSTLNNGKFKSRYGVTVAKFGALMTYGGQLRITPLNRAGLVRRGFHVAGRTKSVVFPARNWFTATSFNNESHITSYLSRTFLTKVDREL